MTAEELDEVLKTVNANRPHIAQTMNFNAPIGQQIAYVDKIEAHFDKDMSMQITNVGDLAVDKVNKDIKSTFVAKQKIIEDAEIIPITTEEVIADAIHHVMGLKDENGDYIFTHKNQWFGIYRILADKKIVQANAWDDFGRYIDALNIKELRVSHSAGELDKYNKDPFCDNFKKWDRSKVKSGLQFDRISRVAQFFKAKIDELLPE